MKYAKSIIRIILLCTAIVIAFVAFSPDWIDAATAVFHDRSEAKRLDAENAAYRHAQKYPIPKDRQLSIRGTLSETPFDMDISYTVTYTAREIIAGCWSYNFFIGKDPHIKVHRYRASIAKNSYSIDLPLNEHPAYEGCHFQPSTISIGLSRAGETAKATDYLFGDEKQYRNLRTVGYSTASVDKHQMVIECRQPVLNGKQYDNSWVCYQDSGDNGLGPLIQRLYASANRSDWNIDIRFVSDTQSRADDLLARQKFKARDDVIDMMRLKGAYLMVVNEPVRDKTAAEFLSVVQGIMDMSAHQTSPFIDEYNKLLAKVQRGIAHDNGIPVDPWGRPYQFALRKTRPDSAPRPELYSLGADGIESDDDIGGWNLDTIN